MSKPLHWQVFCQVIDNFGDAGVCYRLARDLAQRGHLVELCIDRPELLQWMATENLDNLKILDWHQNYPNKSTSHSKKQQFSTPTINTSDALADVVIEAFGCEIPESLKHKIADQARSGKQHCIWVNLEYLSAQPYAQRNHGLLSPVLSGPAMDAHKWFYYPGFTHESGGLIREDSVQARVNAQFVNAQGNTRWFHTPGPQNIALELNTPNSAAHTYAASTPLTSAVPTTSSLLRVGLFCYPNAPVSLLLNQLRAEHLKTGIMSTIFVAQGEIQSLVTSQLRPSKEGSQLNLSQSYHTKRGGLRAELLPYISQVAFDEMLWANDLNFVRGEDSLIRAIWVGKPWIWQIYEQSDGAHHDKLNAVLSTLDCPDFIKSMHWAWNAEGVDAFVLPALSDTLKWAAWRAWCLKIRGNLMEQSDLVTRLVNFVRQKR